MNCNAMLVYHATIVNSHKPNIEQKWGKNAKNPNQPWNENANEPNDDEDVHGTAFKEGDMENKQTAKHIDYEYYTVYVFFSVEIIRTPLWF